jgi:hypothetical protein
MGLNKFLKANPSGMSVSNWVGYTSVQVDDTVLQKPHNRSGTISFIRTKVLGGAELSYEMWPLLGMRSLDATNATFLSRTLGIPLSPRLKPSIIPIRPPNVLDHNHRYHDAAEHPSPRLPCSAGHRKIRRSRRQVLLSRSHSRQRHGLCQVWRNLQFMLQRVRKGPVPKQRTVLPARD